MGFGRGGVRWVGPAGRAGVGFGRGGLGWVDWAGLGLGLGALAVLGGWAVWRGCGCLCMVFIVHVFFMMSLCLSSCVSQMCIMGLEQNKAWHW